MADNFAAGHSLEAHPLKADLAEGFAGHRWRPSRVDRTRSTALPLSEEQYTVQGPAPSRAHA